MMVESCRWTKREAQVRAIGSGFGVLAFGVMAVSCIQTSYAWFFMIHVFLGVVEGLQCIYYCYLIGSGMCSPDFPKPPKFTAKPTLEAEVRNKAQKGD